MNKKSKLSFISEKKSRQDGWEYSGWAELATLHSGYLALKEPEQYQTSLHVIAIASCIEAFCKSCLKILIDEDGTPYLERAKGFKDIAFDFELTRALSNKEITFGDLVSHSISISGIDQIIKNFDTLLNGDKNYKGLKDCISKTREFIEPPEESVMAGVQTKPEFGELLVAKPDKLLSDINEIFSARHIAAHEANFKLVQKEQLLEWFESAMLFMSTTFEIIEQRIRPGISRSAFGSSVQALINAESIGSQIPTLMQELITTWEANWDIDQNTSKAITLKAEEATSAYSNYIQKELEIQNLRVGFITGNGYRHLEAKTRKLLYEARISYINQIKSTT